MNGVIAERVMEILDKLEKAEVERDRLREALKNEVAAFQELACDCDLDSLEDDRHIAAEKALAETTEPEWSEPDKDGYRWATPANPILNRKDEE